MVTIRRSSIAELRANEHGLTRRHYAEVHGHDRAQIDWQIYEQAGNSLDVLAVWDDARLVGYLVATHVTQPHDGARLAVVDAIYVAPEFRAGGTADRLVGAAEAVTKAGGADLLTIGVGPSSVAHRWLSRKAGWRAIETIFAKELG